MANSSFSTNAASGGVNFADYVDSGTVAHPRVILETQTGTSDPATVNASNPLPIANYFGTTAASVNSGNLDGGTLRVVLATNSPSLANANPVTQSGSWTVNLGTLNGVALDSSVNGLLIAQGAALGTNKGPLLQGSVTTAAPTYTTGNVNPLSLTTGGALRVDASAATVPVSGTFWQATQPVSAAALPLPSGAATAAKQPALGTAGTASTDVITVQGIASMVALKVDGSAVTQPVSGTFWQATQPVSLASLPALPAGTNSIGTVQPGNTANTTPWLVTDTPAASGGLSSSTIVSAASNNLTQIKSSAGQLYFAHAGNLNASPRYVKVFFKPSASVTMGTTAADTQFMIPGNTAGAGFVADIDKGIGGGGTGLTIAITGGISLTDNTSISANEVCLSVGYK